MDMKRMLAKLKNNSRYLTRQQYKTIRGQILAGDVQGAAKGLEKLLSTRKPSGN